MAATFKEQFKDLFREAKQIKDEGRHVEALKKLDEIQQLIKQNLGEQSPELQAVYNEIAILCNVLSMAHLQKEDFKLCQDLLKKAELFTETNDRMRAITYNNYACLFRKTNKLRNALTYLEKALDLEYNCLNQSEDPVDEQLKISNPCEIHLNICAILSQMNKHDLALHHAMKALILIEDELLSRTSEASEQQTNNDDRFTVMVIALHNIAVEHEYLKQFSQSLTHYKKARDFAVQALGPEHMMSKKMDLVFQQAAGKICEQLEKQSNRKKGTAKQAQGYSLAEILATGTLPDNSQEIEAQFKGLTNATNTTVSSVVSSAIPRQQRSPPRGTQNPYTNSAAQKKQ